MRFEINDLAAGLYLLEGIDQNGQVFQKKITIE